MAQNPAWLINKHPKNLKAQIRELVERGYVLVSQDATSAQLMRKKSFSFLIAFLSLFVFGFGFLLYCIWYLAKRDETVYLDLETQVYDPNWNKKSAGLFQSSTLKAIAIVFGVLILIGMISAAFDSGKPKTTPEAGVIPYKVAFQDEQAGKGLVEAVVIPKDATAEQIKALAGLLRQKYEDKTFARIYFLTDEKAAANFEEFQNTGLSGDAEKEFDRAWVAMYSKNRNTALDRLEIYPNGFGTEKTTVNF